MTDKVKVRRDREPPDDGGSYPSRASKVRGRLIETLLDEAISTPGVWCSVDTDGEVNRQSIYTRAGHRVLEMRHEQFRPWTVWVRWLDD